MTSTETIRPGGRTSSGKSAKGACPSPPSTTCANCSGVPPHRSGDQRFHDHQRSGAADPRNVPERRRPAGGSGLRGRARTPAFRGRVPRTENRDPADGARDGAGRHPQGGPGSKHLHLFHRLRASADGRRPGVLHRNEVRNFYSVSISGYHIAEAGRTRSRSSPSPWPTASPTSSTTSPGVCRSTPSRRTFPSSSATVSIPSTPSWPAWPGGSGRAP